ncbi:hypothetical protein H0H87_009560 [Tephrocybe sp. NHM501043]|nr:hypothetical protein H0H87_009560 [Tephrocybe sp. NHM501043]
MTFAVLRALQTILADALDDIERIYLPEKESLDNRFFSEGQKGSYASPPPSPSTSQLPLDFPSLDAPYDPRDPSEQLTSHPVVVQAINRIVAAAGQMAMTVQAPTDELFKSSAYLTEAYLLERTDPSRPPFGYAFDTNAGFFSWLEGDGGEDRKGFVNKDKLRVARFGKAMSGTNSWEAPGAVFNGFDWRNLPRGSVIVDVGGGIGSTSMLLANAFCRSSESGSGASSLSSPLLSDFPHREREEQDEDLGFKFIIQDRPVVVEMGEKNAAVFFLRVILHDWPDSLARAILLQLREAATPETKLVLAEFVLPLACVDVDLAEDALGGGVLDDVEGAESTLAHPPLLANLGKASANAYWMDLTMQVIFNAQERTLRETTSLALSAGWKVVKVTRSPGSLFGHIIAVPIPIPLHRRARAGSGSAFLDVPPTAKATQSADVPGLMSKNESRDIEHASSRSGTPTFGSRTDLPSMQEALSKFGSRLRVPHTPLMRGMSRQPAVITNSSSIGTAPPVRKKKPSPLALSSPKPHSPSPVASPRLTSPHPPMRRRPSIAQLRSPTKPESGSAVPYLLAERQGPPSPMSPKDTYSMLHTLTRRGSNARLTHTPKRSLTAVKPPSPPQQIPASPSLRHRSLSRPKSLAHLYQTAQSQNQQPRSPIPPLPPLRPSLPLSPQSSSPPPRQGPIPRRASHAPAPQTSSLRKRSGSIISPIEGAGIGGAISMASLLKMGKSVRGSGGGTLNFGEGGAKAELQPEPAGEMKVSVLAAAARIERGVLSRASSP